MNGVRWRSLPRHPTRSARSASNTISTTFGRCRGGSAPRATPVTYPASRIPSATVRLTALSYQAGRSPSWRVQVHARRHWGILEATMASGSVVPAARVAPPPRASLHDVAAHGVQQSGPLLVLAVLIGVLASVGHIV